MPIDEALEMQWHAVARQIFPLDWAFHPDIAKGLHLLNKGDEPGSIIDAIEEVPFEEWQAFTKYAVSNYPSEASEFLWFIATHHHDSSWRYNAVQQLIDAGALAQPDIGALVSKEPDLEIIDLLRESDLLDP